ncbi:hypothetical protein T484DRAFT_1895112, partial [Baffinella frigidus]
MARAASSSGKDGVCGETGGRADGQAGKDAQPLTLDAQTRGSSAALLPGCGASVGRAAAAGGTSQEGSGAGGRKKEKAGKEVVVDLSKAPPAPLSLRLVGLERKQVDGRVVVEEEDEATVDGRVVVVEEDEETVRVAFSVPHSDSAALRDVQAQTNLAPAKLQRLEHQTGERSGGGGSPKLVCCVSTAALVREGAVGGECQVQLRVRRAGGEWSAWSKPLPLLVKHARGGRSNSGLAGSVKKNSEEASKASTDSEERGGG